MPFTSKPWDGSASRFPTPEAYCRSALIDDNPSGQAKTKALCHLPVKEPDGTYNVNAIRNALARVNQVQTSAAKKARARSRLQSLLAEAGGTPTRSEEAPVADLYRISPPSALIFRDEDGEQTVEAMVVPYGQWSEVDSVVEGHFMEQFAPRSLRKTFAETFHRLRGYFEHGRDRAFGRTAVMEVKEAWETDEGAFMRASLMRGLPEWMVDGIRRGQYGVSLGAEPKVVKRDRHPKPSEHNPKGLEERTYQELRAFDISLTPAPHYEGTTAMLRSISDELTVKQLVEQPERLLQLLREVREAEPPHSVPEAPEGDEPEPDSPPEDEPEEPKDEPDESPEEPQGSRDTQPPTIDYLANEEEEEWQL